MNTKLGTIIETLLVEHGLHDFLESLYVVCNAMGNARSGVDEQADRFYAVAKVIDENNL